MHIWKHQVSSDLLLRSTFLIKSIVSDRTKKLVRSYSKVIENTICVILCHQLQLRCGTIDQNIIYKIFAAKIFQVCSCVSTPPINLFISTYLSIYLYIYLIIYLIYIYIYIYIYKSGFLLLDFTEGIFKKNSAIICYMLTLLFPCQKKISRNPNNWWK